MKPIADVLTGLLEGSWVSINERELGTVEQVTLRGSVAYLMVRLESNGDLVGATMNEVQVLEPKDRALVPGPVATEPKPRRRPAAAKKGGAK